MSPGKKSFLFALPALLPGFLPCTALAQQAAGTPPIDPNLTTPGELLVDPPTLQNLGFEWFIDGDANRNASVAVAYREQGTQTWKDALPLLRIGGERIYSESQVDVITPPMFAGSILDLVPDTAYEARFTLTDPDGVGANAERVLTVRTRPEPRPYAGGRVLHVYPPGYQGEKQQPAYEGLMCAYNFWCAGTDWTTAGRPRVRPGDTLLLHAGTYKYNRYEYTNNPLVNRTTPLDGTYYLTADGTAEMPIAIKAAGDGDVIFDGDGNYALFNVQAADYTYFEGITFRNAEVAILAGTQFIAGSKGLTVKHSRFEDVGAGVFTNYSGSSNFYIADNWFYGRNDPEHLIGWAGDALWSRFNGVEDQVFPPVMASYVAVKLYGPGHVVAYNYIADFHDGINVETYGNPDGSVASGPGIVDGPHYPPREFWDRRPVAIDFYNNYITNSHDNPIEADGSMHNVRIMRNMLINHPSHALCNQPALGGPVYWIRNIAYNLPGGSTRLTGGSAGVLFYNNTILSETSGNTQNSHWRNNLILGQNAAAGFNGVGEPVLFAITTYTNYTSSDYNGFGPMPGAKVNFGWNSPALDVLADYPGPGRRPALQTRAFASLQEYSQATGQDSHSVMLDYSVFVKVPRLDATDMSTVQKLYDASDLDFSLVRGSAAIDKGLVLPNVTDGSEGAPDLGALEFGAELPHYGPRPRAATAEATVAQGLYNWIHTTGNADLSFPFYRDIFGFELEHSTFATVNEGAPPPTIRSRDEARSDPLIWQLTDTEGSRARTVFMGTPGIGFGLELSEFLDIARDERHASPWDPGNSFLVFEVKDFGEVLRRLEASGTPVVTAGGQAMRMESGDAIMVRDPDGYLVMVRSSVAGNSNSDTGMVTDIDIGLSVASTEDSLRFYRDLMQFEIGATIALPDEALALSGLDAGRLLQTTTRIPNTEIDVLLWEFDVPNGTPVQPRAWRIQDVGAPQFQLQVRDLDDLLLRTRAAGFDFLSVGGQPIQRPFGRFVFAKDPDSVLVEYVEPSAHE